MVHSIFKHPSHLTYYLYPSLQKHYQINSVRFATPIRWQNKLKRLLVGNDAKLWTRLWDPRQKLLEHDFYLHQDVSLVCLAKPVTTNLSIVDHCTRFQQCIYPIFALPNDYHPRSNCTSISLIGAKTIILCYRAWMAPKALEIAAFMSRSTTTFGLCVTCMQNNQSVCDFHRPPVCFHRSWFSSTVLHQLRRRTAPW